jgi:hypothetical protein
MQTNRKKNTKDMRLKVFLYSRIQKEKRQTAKIELIPVYESKIFEVIS